MTNNMNNLGSMNNLGNINQMNTLNSMNNKGSILDTAKYSPPRRAPRMI